MVTSRSTGSRADGFKIAYQNYLLDFGTKVVLNKKTETFDSMNRMIGTSTSSVTIIADIQWVTKKDLQHLNISDVQVGDGQVFVKFNADVSLEDEVVYAGKTYRIVTQIEGEQVGGEVVYKGYLIRLNAQV